MIVFKNPGTLDRASIATFGVSSKEKVGAIGYFGTGLKYAIAILLREGCEVTIHTGGESLTFGVETARVRADDFDFVTMNGERLGFTTELGKNWDVSGALRELYCNCLDEDGRAFEFDAERDGMVCEAEHTYIMVTGEAFRDAWAKRAEIFLATPPSHKFPSVHVHLGASSHVYYRGVRAYRLSHPSLVTYNIQRKCELTEDRTLKYPWDVNASINMGVMESDDASLIERLVTPPEGTHEKHTHSWGGVVPSPAFIETVRRLSRDFNPRLDASAKDACRPWLLDDLHEAEPLELTKVDATRLERAIVFCERLGYPVRSYPIRVTAFLGESVLGQAHNHQIFLSQRVFQMGTKVVAGTLIEEFLHLKHNLPDESRALQNYLLDALVSLGEQLIGEPL